MENKEVQANVNEIISTEQQRAIQEVQAMMIIAKRFPRDVDQCLMKIKKACERKSLAKDARYSYPRGGTNITGPSIRIMEAIAVHWQNLNFGIAELSQSDGVSDVEAFAWDLETNVRMSKTFKVSHTRKAQGAIKVLNDPRDIYEMVANQGARRLRACLMSVVPRDVVEFALENCEKALNSDEEPLEDRIRKMLTAFDKYGVSKEMLERYLGHETKYIEPSELIHLIDIYNALRDGIGKRSDWFKMAPGESQPASDLNETINGAEKEEEKTAFPQTETEPENYWDNRDNWFKKRKAGFAAAVIDHEDELSTCAVENLVDAERKWKAFYPDKPWPLDTEGDSKPETEIVEPAATEGATTPELSERDAVWNAINDKFYQEDIKQALSNLNMGNAKPPTIDGCQALYDHLLENFERAE